MGRDIQGMLQSSYCAGSFTASYMAVSNIEVNKDVAVTLGSLAISAAMSIGLHRPLNSHDFKREFTWPAF
jgi:hypothetical protein